jgi:hypothetical protein
MNYVQQTCHLNRMPLYILDEMRDHLLTLVHDSYWGDLDEFLDVTEGGQLFQKDLFQLAMNHWREGDSDKLRL